MRGVQAVEREEVAEPRVSRLRRFRPDIEGFRALAILLVVIHHSGVPIFGGVDTSFVLSGFLTTSILINEVFATGRVAFGKFYARRARRLFPLAMVVIATTVIASWLWLPVFKLRAVGLDGLFSALSAINWRLAAGATDYFAENTNSSPFQHFWSLAVEEQFYLLWPLLFLAVAWLGHRLRLIKTTLAFVLVLVIAVSLYFSVIVTQTAQPWAYFGFHTRAWELAIGALVAVGANLFARMWQPLAAAVSWAGLVIIGIGSVMIAKSLQVPGSVMLWPVLGTAMFIIGGCAAPRFGAEWLIARKAPRYLGRLSYGWYLWHWPVLIIAPYALGHSLAVWENLVAVVGSLGLAAATYYLVEKPAKAWKLLVEIPARGLEFGAWFIGVSAFASLVLVAATAATANPVERTDSYTNQAQITQLVAQAVQIKTVPPLVTGRLATAKQDLYPGCIANITDTVADACNLGDPNGTSQIVLLGSSLAWQWIPSVNIVAQTRNAKLAVFTKGSCPAEMYAVDIEAQSVDGVNVPAGPYTQCETWRQDAYAKIAALHPKLVVMSSRVEARATPAEIRDSVQYFRQLGAAVVVIGETPSLGFDGPECLSVHSDAFQKCIANRQVVFADRSQSDMATAVAREAGAKVIDPLPWLCTQQQCPPAIGNQIVYWDDHHLSASYAASLSAVLGQQLPL